MLPDGYAIRDLTAADAPALAAAYRRNREHLAPFEPVRDDSFYTDAGQHATVARQLDTVRTGQHAAWLVWHGDDVVGRANLNNVVLGAFHSASLGYWVDIDHQRRGLASACAEHAVSRAVELGLHRVEAGTLLDNVASQRVLERAGFTAYGEAPQYLFVGGAWRDHRLFQRILHDEPM